jgi:hypothetical protein
MLTIYKYKLGTMPAIGIKVLLPQGAQVLSAGIQNEEFVIWALRDGTKSDITRRFSVFATGQPIDYPVLVERLVFIGTVFTQDGLVFHIFENI